MFFVSKQMPLCFLYLEGRFDVFKFGGSLLVNKETTFYQWAELRIGKKNKKFHLKHDTVGRCVCSLNRSKLILE